MTSQIPSRSIPGPPSLFTPRLAATAVTPDDGDGDGDCDCPAPPTPAVDAVDVRRALVTAATKPGAVTAVGNVDAAVMLANRASASAVSVA